MSNKEAAVNYPERNKWWDIDLNAYDQSCELTEDEIKGLDPFLRFRRRVASTADDLPYHSAELQRLMTPLLDIARNSHSGNINPIQHMLWRRAFRLIMTEMAHRKRTYWAWGDKEWAEILCPDNATFKSKHQTLPARLYLMKVAYLLGKYSSFHNTALYTPTRFAKSIFGYAPIDDAFGTVNDQLLQWGYRDHEARRADMLRALNGLFLLNRSPLLRDLKPELLNAFRSISSEDPFTVNIGNYIHPISRVLVAKGLIHAEVKRCSRWDGPSRADIATIGVSPEWASWCKRWRSTTTLQKRSSDTAYSGMLMAGRWLFKEHPEVTSPAGWTRELCADFIAAVDGSVVGQWISGVVDNRVNAGKPISPKTKDKTLSALRTFFRDCQEWEWIDRRFNPHRDLATPRSVLKLIGPAPRVIADDIWAKLLWAALNLMEADLPKRRNRGNEERPYCYPIEMVRAVAVIWLFSGIRNDEIIRLRAGCVRWLSESVSVIGDGGILSKDTICMLEVPANKTSTEFTKPVDRVVGEAIEAWERVRPRTPLLLDPKTNEMIHYLFSQRAKRLGKSYINNALVPILCKKAGIPTADAKGDITSHRARSTMATKLANCKDPMTLLELMQWLGHSDINATLHYVETTPLQLGKAYQDADFFSRNIRTIQVLIDQDAITSGAAAKGEPWRYYDLGHGHCLNEFFVQCPHRAACAKCAFYAPKDSAKALLIEGKTNLLRMRQEIPLTEDEIAAVDEGIEAFEKLCDKLADVPTPSGATPNQLSSMENAKPFTQITRLKLTGS